MIISTSRKMMLDYDKKKHCYRLAWTKGLLRDFSFGTTRISLRKVVRFGSYWL